MRGEFADRHRYNLRQDPMTPSGDRNHRAVVDALLTADDVAALLRVNRNWVYAGARAGRIPHVRLGRYVRYRRSAIEAWVEELEAASAATDRPSRQRVPSG